MRREISADYAAARAVQLEILAAAEELGLQGKTFFAAKLSVEEAFIHAIKTITLRMNRSPALVPPQKLYVEAAISSAGVKITVQERG